MWMLTCGFVGGFLGRDVVGRSSVRCVCRRPVLGRVGTKRVVGRWSCQEPLFLSEENVNMVLVEAKETLQTMFGNSDENRAVGITGDVELVELDGVTVILRMTGRFWHKRSDVLARVASYLQQRIPEACDVQIEDMAQLDDADEAIDTANF